MKENVNEVLGYEIGSVLMLVKILDNVSEGKLGHFDISSKVKFLTTNEFLTLPHSSPPYS